MKLKVTHLKSEDGIGQLTETVYRYKCISCGRVYDDKKEFKGHLEIELDQAYDKADWANEQLLELNQND